MSTRRSGWLAAALLWPWLGWATEADLPALGVHLSALPEGAAAPEVSAQPGGLQAVTRAGRAQLSIFREDTPAPAGSDVADPRYRAVLDRRFPGVASRDDGAPTALATHSAWTVVAVHPAADAATLYTCLTYVIVDQHLYRMVVTAESLQGRPAEFDSLVVAMSGIKFEPVRAAGATDSGSHPG